MCVSKFKVYSSINKYDKIAAINFSDDSDSEQYRKCVTQLNWGFLWLNDNEWMNPAIIKFLTESSFVYDTQESKLKDFKQGQVT